MIRNGYVRRLEARVQRSRLLERWQGYPGPVQVILHTLLRDHGLQAAQLATRAVEEYVGGSEPGLQSLAGASPDEERRNSDGQ